MGYHFVDVGHGRERNVVVAKQNWSVANIEFFLEILKDL